MHYDAYRFVQGIREKFWLGMLSAIDAALIAEARRPAGEERGQRPGSDAEYMWFLMGAREYLLSEGRTRPARMHDDAFGLLKPLCEQLVQQGRFERARLELFAGLDAWPIGGQEGDSEGWERRA